MNTFPTYRQGRTYYRPGSNDNGPCCSIVFLTIISIFLLLPPILLVSNERSHHLKITSLTSLTDIKPLTTTTTSPPHPGDMIHLTTPLPPSTITTDPEMNLSLSGSLSLRRRTEYCQWNEIRREDCETCVRRVTAKDGTESEERYRCNCVTRFSYVKGWQNRLINSFLFDQPAAHYNPSRDPLPSRVFRPDAGDVDVEMTNKEEPTTSAGDAVATTTITIPRDIVHRSRAPYRRVNWRHPNTPPPQPWFWQRWWFPDTTRYEKMERLRRVEHSRGVQEHNFIFIDNSGGYFFSAYTASQAERLSKWFFQYLEGSLFDWQFGDLMPSCTPGDIRIRYEVMDPELISVLAEVKTMSKKAGKVTLRSREVGEKGETKLGFLHQGPATAGEMIRTEMSDSVKRANMFRGFCLLWAFAMAHLIGALVGKDVAHSSLVVKGMATLSVWCGIIGVTWVLLWGLSLPTMSVLGFMAYSALVTRRLVPASNAKGGVTAVWCMIGRWAKVPPEWRKEDSYLQPSSESSATMGSSSSSSSFKKKTL